MNPQPRRSMSQALQTANLPDEALAFVKEGTPKPKAQNPQLSTVPPSDEKPSVPSPPMKSEPASPAGEEAAESESSPSGERARQTRPKPREKTDEGSVGGSGFVSMTFRLPSEIPPSLLRASSERKIKKLRPFTQQEIVAEALSQWLR